MAVPDNIGRAIEYLFTPSPAIFIVGTLIVLLVPVLLHLLIVRKTPYTTLPSILLVGPSGAGKTSLVTLLETGDKLSGTHTSQVPHSVELTVSTDGAAASFREAAKEDAPGSHRKFLLVDTPGHGKLRNHAMAKVVAAQSLKGIVFVLDSATIEDTLAATATYLYDVLLALQKRIGSSKTSRAPNAIHVLVAANKLDLFTALPASLVKSKLEAELGRIRLSRSKGLLDSGVGMDDIGAEENDEWLGEYGSDKFLFTQMREFDLEVDVVGGSVLEGKVDKWWDWVAERI
jgi:signal recognition particle receptor subunit beta